MEHREQVSALLEQWAAGQASGEPDTDTFWGPMRMVAGALADRRRQAERDGLVRGQRHQQFAVSQLPEEHVLARAVDEDRAVNVGIDLRVTVAAGSAQPGSVAAGAVSGLVPAQRPGGGGRDVQQTAVQVVCTPLGWRVVDVQEQGPAGGAWFSSQFCVHGFALPLPAHDTEDRAEFQRAVSCGLVFRSLAAHVTSGPAGTVVSHTVSVSNGRNDDVVASFSPAPASKAQEDGHLLPALSSLVLQLPPTAAGRVFLPLRLRQATRSRLRTARVEHLRLGVSIPEQGHPQEGWCRVPVTTPVLAPEVVDAV